MLVRALIELLYARGYRPDQVLIVDRDKLSLIRICYLSNQSGEGFTADTQLYHPPTLITLTRTDTR